MNRLRTAAALLAYSLVIPAGSVPAGAQTATGTPSPASAGPVDPSLIEDLVIANHKTPYDRACQRLSPHVKMPRNCLGLEG